MSYDDFETDLSGEIQEAREMDLQHECRMRDIAQGIEPGGEDE